MLRNLLINDVFGKSVSIYGSRVVQKEHIFLMQIQTQKEENINKMSSNMEEEALSNCVQQYKVLYDKSHKDLHRKDIKKNAWNTVAEEVGLEDGAEAEKEFTKLREKCSRYKRDLKKKDVSGTYSAAVQKAKKKREELNYLSWLDIYTQPPKSKINIEGKLAVSQIASQVSKMMTVIKTPKISAKLTLMQMVTNLKQVP